MNKKYGYPGNHVVHEDFGDEVVAINLKTGIYYSLADSGRFIWNLLKNNPGEDKIIGAVLQTYRGDEASMKSAVKSFIDALIKEDLIRVVENESEDSDKDPAADIPAATPMEKKSFESPMINRHSDQKELLLLDPIHEVDDLGWPEKKDDPVGRG